MKRWILFLMMMLIVSCEVKPAKILFGQDQCDYCTMTVVDRRFASQLVTSKGKSYNFDSVECMLAAKAEKYADKEMAYERVADFAKPGEMINARSAVYLASDKVATPMTGGIIAFKDRTTAEKFLIQYPGHLYNWEEIQQIKHQHHH